MHMRLTRRIALVIGSCAIGMLLVGAFAAIIHPDHTTAAPLLTSVVASPLFGALLCAVFLGIRPKTLPSRAFTAQAPRPNDRMPKT